MGAPYEGDGAVYIFRGQDSATGIEMSEGEPMYSQRIYASDLTSAPGLTSFGYALVAGMDMDGNEYPDLAVGSYESDTVWMETQLTCIVFLIKTEFLLFTNRL